MKSEPIVQFKNVTKRINKRIILDDINFELRRGEILGLTGPSETGKSAVVRMLLGLSSITEGEIFVNGHSIRHDYENAIAETGVIFRNPAFYGQLDGYCNLIHFTRMGRGVERGRIDEVMRLAGIEEAARDKAKTYSAGMRFRLGFAVAILRRPLLIILEEPAGGLNSDEFREVWGCLRTYAEKERAAILVSGNGQSSLESVCDRICAVGNRRLTEIQTAKIALGGNTNARND